MLRAELLGRERWYVQLLLDKPCAMLAVGVLAGVVIQSHFNFSPFLWGCVCLLLACLFFSSMKISLLNNVVYKTAFVFLCFFCVGGLRLASFESAGADDIRNFASEDSQFVHIRGEIISDPFVVEPGDWLMAWASRCDAYTSFYANVHQIKSADGWAEISGTVKFYVGEAAESFGVGDVFESFCKIKTFSSADNPGQFDVRQNMANRGVFVSASTKSAEAIKITERRGDSFFSKAQGKLRTIATMGVESGLDSEDAAGMLNALLLGNRSKISRDIYKAFGKTGLLHFISLSGMHVGIFVWSVWWFGKKCGLACVGRAVLCILALGVFVVIVPARTATLRASLMCLVFFMGHVFKRKSSVLNSLGIAAIIIMLFRPRDVFGAGFAMSFGAVLGILFFGRGLGEIFFWPIRKIRYAFARRALAAAANILAVGISAWIGVSGVLVWHFHEVHPLSPLWTVLAFPFVSVILMGGVFKIFLSVLLPSLGGYFGAVLGAVVNFFIFFVRLLAEVPGNVIVVGKISGWVILGYYLLVGFWGLRLFQHKMIKHICCGAGMVFIFSGVMVFNPGRIRDGLHFDVLSVGAGQCAAAELAGGEFLMFDCCSISKNDVGSKIVLPYLNYSGIKKIEAVYLSHNDIDHYNGVAEAIEGRTVGKFYLVDKFISQMGSSNTAGVFGDFLKSRGLEINRPEEVMSYGETTVRKLWPGADGGDGLSDNDSSLVMMIEYAGRKIMLCSDISLAGQTELARLYEGLDVDVLISPHHGSVNTAMDGFAGVFKPEYVITSCAGYQYDRIIKSEKSDIAYKTCESFFTSRHGRVSVAIDSEGRIVVNGYRL